MFYNNENQAENKLLILYLLKLSPRAVYQQPLSDLMISGNQMDYFTIQQTLGQLKKSKFIREIQSSSEHRKLMIEPLGVQTLNYFQNRLSKNQIHTIEELYKRNRNALLNNIKIQSSYEKISDHQWKVSLYYKDERNEESHLSFTLNSEDDAKDLVLRWESRYHALITQLKKTLLNSGEREVRE